jgi:hypothetical protein
MIAKNIDINQSGIMVLLRYPTPKALSVPSGLYINAGLIVLISANKAIYKIIATDALLFLTQRGFII